MGQSTGIFMFHWGISKLLRMLETTLRKKTITLEVVESQEKQWGIWGTDGETYNFATIYTRQNHGLNGDILRSVHPHKTKEEALDDYYKIEETLGVYRIRDE
jgi:hypothetical protein